MSNVVCASRIWPIYSDDHVRYVRVKNNVANITNRQILIRMVLPNPTEPGLYNIGAYGELKKVNPSTNMLQYPDIDLLEGFFSNLKPLCSLDVYIRNHLIDICRDIAKEDELAIITSDRIRAKYVKPGASELMYPFNLSPEITINAKYLEIVLTTFKDYPVLHMGRANGETSPLIVGIDWGNCAFIAPFSRNY